MTELEDRLARAWDGLPPVAIIPLDPPGTPGRLSRHHLAFDRLIDTGEPFVAVTFASREEESPEDRAMQAQWFRSRLPQLEAQCRLLVIVEQDEAQRLKLQRRSAEARAFPIPLLVVRSVEEGVSLAYGASLGTPHRRG
jgi:hypothetical protein